MLILGCCLQTAAALSSTLHAAGDAAWCEAQLAALHEPYEQSVKPDYARALQETLKLSEQCAGTGVYESRVAGTYLRLGKIDEAKKILTGITDPNIRKLPLVKAAALQTIAGDIVLSKASSDRLQALESAYLDLVTSAPNWHVAYELAGHYALFIGNNDKAIEFASKATRLEPQSWFGYRTLAVAQTNKGAYLETARAGDKAHSLRKAVSADPEFMFSLSKSYAAMGDVEMSKTLLSLLLNHRPEVRGTPEYIETLKYVAEESKKRASQ